MAASSGALSTSRNMSLAIWFVFCAFNCVTAQQPSYQYGYGYQNNQQPYSPCNYRQPCASTPNCAGCANGVNYNPVNTNPINNPINDFNSGTNLCGATMCQLGQYCIAGRCVSTTANGFGPSANGFGPGANGFGPNANGFGPGANGFGPGANGFGPNTNPYQQNQFCQWNTDCLPGSSCQGGRCVSAQLGGFGGGLGLGNGIQTCSEFQPCISQQICIGGVCVESGNVDGYFESTTCLSNDFCEINQICQAGFCVNNQPLLPPLGNANGGPPCSAYQPCIAGQTCLGGRCLSANQNTAFMGITSCGSGSTCPYGQCQNGFCTSGNQLPPSSIGFACANGICPNGMFCQNSQCLPSALSVTSKFNTD